MGSFSLLESLFLRAAKHHLHERHCLAYVFERRSQKQPRSQGLSSLPLVVGRKTLVEAGHMTTQNLGGKKILLGGRRGTVLCLVDVTNLWASNPLAVAKNYSPFRSSKSNLPMMNAL